LSPRPGHQTLVWRLWKTPAAAFGDFGAKPQNPSRKRSKATDLLRDPGKKRTLVSLAPPRDRVSLESRVQRAMPWGARSKKSGLLCPSCGPSWSGGIKKKSAEGFIFCAPVGAPAARLIARSCYRFDVPARPGRVSKPPGLLSRLLTRLVSKRDGKAVTAKSPKVTKRGGWCLPKSPNGPVGVLGHCGHSRLRSDHYEFKGMFPGCPGKCVCRQGGALRAPPLAFWAASGLSHWAFEFPVESPPGEAWRESRF